MTDADTFGPHRMERDKKGPFCFHCQVNWPCMPVEAYRTGRADVARLEAERDEARATVRRMLHAATELLRREMQHSGRGRDGHLNVDDVAIVLNAIGPPAVDQTTPSSPLETPHTADSGEAGVVEGAGGSEAAEGEQVAAWELQAIKDEQARRTALLDRTQFDA